MIGRRTGYSYLQLYAAHNDDASRGPGVEGHSAQGTWALTESRIHGPGKQEVIPSGQRESPGTQLPALMTFAAAVIMGIMVSKLLRAPATCQGHLASAQVGCWT
jgi:hypothetical protein